MATRRKTWQDHLSRTSWILPQQPPYSGDKLAGGAPVVHSAQALPAASVVQESNAPYPMPMHFGLSLAIWPDIMLQCPPELKPSNSDTNRDITMVPAEIMSMD